jgi:FG-GAP-like repeat/Secretion system C-terminal sorting domain
MRRRLQVLPHSKPLFVLATTLSLAAACSALADPAVQPYVTGFETIGPADNTFLFSFDVARFTPASYPGILRFTGSGLDVFSNDGHGQLVDTNHYDLRTPWHVLGDFDGDGALDIALVSDSLVTINRGDGAGSFTFLTESPSLVWAIAAVSADLDSDGLPDIVTGIEEDSITVRMNVAGSFPNSIRIPSLCKTIALSLCDVNRDSLPDLIQLSACENVGDSEAQLLSVYRNRGHGEFDAPLHTKLWVRMRNLECGDVDGDGWPDIVLSSPWWNGVFVLWNNGAGIFPLVDNIPIAGVGGPMALGDFDHDGRSDIAIASANSDVLPTFLSRGGRSLEPRSFFLSDPSQCSSGLPAPVSVAISDLDQDGNPDLVFALGGWYGESSSLGVFRNVNRRASTGNFAYEAMGMKPRSTRLAQFTSTGPPALVFDTDTGIKKMVGRADGTFSPATEVCPSDPFQVLDLNGDGLSDLIRSHDSDSLITALCRPDGQLETAVGHGSVGALVVSGEFDRTPGIDLLTVRADGSHVMMINDGHGRFTEAPVSGIESQGAIIASGDLDGDGLWDVIRATTDALTILHNDGGARFSRSHVYDLPLQHNFPYRDRLLLYECLLGDLNGDGHTDVVLKVGDDPAAHEIFMNDGSGGFGTPTVMYCPREQATTALADLNDDHWLDLVTVGHSGCGEGRLTVQLNQGDGTFEDPEPFIGIKRYPFGPLVADLDGDSYPELIIPHTSSWPGGGILVLHNELGDSGHTPGPPVPQLVSRVEGGHVQLTCDDGRASAAFLERSASASAWQSLARVVADAAGRLAYSDSDVQPGVRYSYRLRVGTWLSAETSVELPHLVFAFEGARPNPTTQDVIVAFTLPDASPATLELIDVSGRRVRMEQARVEAGRQTVDLTRGTTLPAGFYWVRLTQGARRATAKVVVIR